MLPVMVLTNAMVGLIEGGAMVATYVNLVLAFRFELSATAGITTLYAVAHRLREERARLLQEAYDVTLEGWARALELRDREIEAHTRRVADLTLRHGRAFGMPGKELVHLRRGAIAHAIGKMGVPDRVLLKPGAPGDEEWHLLREHPEHANRLLEPVAFLRSGRPFRDAWSAERVVQHLRDNAGTLFDPSVVEVFLEQIVGRSGV